MEKSRIDKDILNQVAETLLCRRIDDVENAAFELAKKLLNKPNMKWDMDYAVNTAILAEIFLHETGRNYCYPSYVADRQAPCFRANKCNPCIFEASGERNWDLDLSGTEEGLAKNLFNTMCCSNVDIPKEHMKIFLDKVKTILKGGQTIGR